MVRKSTPDKALISPVCNEWVRMSHGNLEIWTRSYITEGSTHDDGLLSMLLVVVEDFANGLNAMVFLVLVSRSGLVFLVPVQNTADEG